MDEENDPEKEKKNKISFTTKKHHNPHMTLMTG